MHKIYAEIKKIKKSDWKSVKEISLPSKECGLILQNFPHGLKLFLHTGFYFHTFIVSHGFKRS